MNGQAQRTVVPAHLAGKRLDQALAELFPDFSRTRLKDWILVGAVLVDDRPRRPRDRLAGGERIELTCELEPDHAARPQAIGLTVVYEDEALIVIDKPAGLVVHPGAGNPDGTLLNALLHHDDALAGLPRAGIVHRLDKDTTGLLVVARSLAAHTHLVRAMQAHEIEREYEAVVTGTMTGGGTIDAPLGRHATQRVRMAVREGGRRAVTHYRLVGRYRSHTHVRVRLETGRTHQIRVHLAHQGYPIVGDPVYGGRMILPAGASSELTHALRAFRRQALHAGRLGLAHPISGERMAWQAPLPEDMESLVLALRADADRS